MSKLMMISICDQVYENALISSGNTYFAFGYVIPKFLKLKFIKHNELGITKRSFILAPPTTPTWYLEMTPTHISFANP